MCIRQLTQFLRVFLTAAAGLSASANLAYAQDNTLRILAGRAHSQNPAVCASSNCSMIISNYFETLVRFEQSVGIVPALAESWDISEDYTKFVFHIRPDARWSDGVSISPSVIAESYERLKRLGGSRLALALAMSEFDVQTRDDGQEVLVIETAEPSPHLVSVLSHVSSAPLPVHALAPDEMLEAWEAGAFPETVPMSGAYRLESQSDNFIRLVANEHYYGFDNIGPAAVEITFEDRVDVIPERLSAFVEGEFDLVMPVHLTHMPFFVQAHPTHFVAKDYLNVTYLVFNASQPPFDDRDIREAVILAVPDSMPQAFLNDYYSVDATSFLSPLYPPEFDRLLPPWAEIPYDERLARARDLMESKGYSADNMLKVRFNINSHFAHERLAFALTSWLRQAHIDLETVSDPWAHYLPEILTKGDFQMVRRSAILGVDRPSALLSLFLSDYRSNYMAYSNPDYDEVVRRLIQELDQDRANQATRRALQILYDDFAVLPLYHRQRMFGLSPEISFGALSFSGAPYFHDIFWNDNPILATETSAP